MVGNLIFTIRSFNHRTFMAQLMRRDSTYVAPVLTNARIRITDQGILITGLEVIPLGRHPIKHRSEYHRQSWWCQARPD